MRKAHKEYQDQSTALINKKTEKSLAELTEELTQRVESKSEDALVTLAAQVDALKSQAIVEKSFTSCNANCSQGESERRENSL